MGVLVDELALGATEGKIKALEKKGLEYQYDDIYKKAHQSILEGLQKSIKTVEDWERYPEKWLR
jgi:hypothetical protein